MPRIELTDEEHALILRKREQNQYRREGLNMAIGLLNTQLAEEEGYRTVDPTERDTYELSAIKTFYTRLTSALETKMKELR